jgi:hypothetical protein
MIAEAVFDPGRIVFAIGTAVLAGVWIYVVMGWIAEGEISLATGLTTIVASCFLIAVGVSSQIDAITYGVMGLFVCAPFSLPVYNMIAGNASDRELDLQKFERAHHAFAANPANVGSRFEIARQLAKLGLLGHAIAIARGAETLLTDDQGPHQRGTKLMFAKELSDTKYWESIAKPEDFRNVHCPHCSRPNPPGTIACLKCNAPFLLDIVRGSSQNRHVGGKIVLVWLCLAAVVAGSSLIGSTGGGWLIIFPTALLVIAFGGFASWLLNDRIKFA